MAGMKNLSPHRSFKAPQKLDSNFRPYYQRPWPEDLPDRCEECDNLFRFGWNLTMGPNRLGRFFKKASYVSFLPCLLGTFVVPYLLAKIFVNVNSGVWAFVAYLIFLAPLYLVITSLFMPVCRHVECKNCGWNRDFPIFKKKHPLEKESI